MLKLINHIIKKDKTRHGGSLQVTQFTQNCAHEIVSIKIACILNNSELSRIGDWEGFSLSQCQTVPCLLDPQIPTTISDVRASLLLSKTRKGRDAPSRSRLSLGEGCPLCYAECVAAMRKNWWYRWLYYSCHFIFYSKFQVVAGITPYSDNGKFNHQYKLLGEKWRGNWGYKINAEKNSSKDIKDEWKLYRSILGKYRYTSLELAVRWRSLYGLCTTGLLWARLPCSIGIGDKLSWGNLSTTCGRSPALMVDPRVKFRFSNPVRVAISENKKEHSHNLWHRQI
ncbi:hypothetical protein NIES4075_03480 [Tolypothrix sp. NIES-4075]|uniref:hypothetical protein n=1 Tax=Tolypothrix sp. NIES-4075 TaxID=2005459 RepID=UPI000B5C2DC1|nr:hypothetical protein [Tolypothrix sp. NIES-4075]GAX39392.1 hypothetical protein NIES4075_03480 [Tolypothrix sp. NIES-4075]